MSKGLAKIDVANVRSAEELHRVLASRLAFPAWYGGNWDAFGECVSDPNLSVIPPVLRLHGYDALLKRLPDDARALRRYLTELSRKRRDIRVEWDA